MSILSSIFAYWQSNDDLGAAVPYEKVWAGVVPDNYSNDFPYVVITPIAAVPMPLTAAAYVERFTFQISIYHTQWATLDAIASTVAGQFDYQAVAGAATVSCERTGGPVLMIDPDTPGPVYHAVITYDLLVNKSLPSN